MYEEKCDSKDIDYENEFKIVIGSNISNEIQIPSNQLKSLESFSRSSESLALTVTSIGDKKIEKERRKKKTRSASRGKKEEREKACDFGISRDSGESFMSGIMSRVRQEGWRVVGDSEEERLRLLNIRLEGKFNVTNQASEEGLRERAGIRCELEKARKEIEVERERLQSLERAYKEWSNEKETLLEKSIDLEKKVSILQCDLGTKENQLSDIKQQLVISKDNMSTHEEKMKIVQADMLMKEAVIGDLKKKMSELYTQLELIKLYRENSDYQAEHVRIELEMANNARHRTEEELKAVEEVREQLQLEVHRVKKSLDDISSERDSLEHKTHTFEIKISKLQDARLHETTQLLFELEQLQKEIIVSSNEKDSLEARFVTLTSLYEEKSRELHFENLQNKELQKKYEELFVEFEDAKKHLEELLRNFKLLDCEGNDLRKNVAVLEENLNQKSAEIIILEKENETLQGLLYEVRMSSDEKDNRVSGLVEDLKITKNSLDRVCTEREQANTFIRQLHDECEKVSEQFELSRQNLFNKEEALRLMEDINEELKSRLSNEEKIIYDRNQLIEELHSEIEQLKESRTLLQTNHLQVRQELDNLRHSLTEANMTMTNMETEIMTLTTCNQRLCDERENTEVTMRKIKCDLLEAQHKIEELTIIQQQYSDLLTLHHSTEMQLNDLSGRHESLSKDFQTITDELQSKLQEKDMELQKLVSLKDEVVQTTKKDLMTMERSQSQLKDTLENVKFNHAIELATKEELFREQLEKSEKEFSQMCQEKIRCESAISSLQGHINNLVDDYNKRLKDCKEKMLNLEKKSTAYAEYESKSRDLLMELERKKGEIEGILEEWKKMKQHASILETALARREATVVELVDKHSKAVKKQETKIKDLKKQLIEQQDNLKAENGIKIGLKTQIEIQAKNLDDVNHKLNNFQLNYSILQLEFDKMKKNDEYLLEENRLLKETQEQITNELYKKCEDNRELMKNNEILKGQVTIGKSTDESRTKTLNYLQQEVSQRSRKIEDSNIKHKKLIQNYNLEKKDMKLIVKDVQDKRESLTREAELAQQREIIATSVLSRLRSEVKKIIFENEMFPEKECSSKISKEKLENLDKLLKETEVPVITTKPLSRLSKCIDDLRTQIDSIQDEVSKQCEDIAEN